MYRCGICNVVSRNLIDHDKHLEGKRHKRNFKLALAGDISTTSFAVEPKGKRQKQNAKDMASVEAALERIASEAAADTEALFEQMLAGETSETTATSVPLCSKDSARSDEDIPSEKIEAIRAHLKCAGGSDKITRVGSKFGVQKAVLNKYFHVVWPEGAAEHFVSLSASFLPSADLVADDLYDSDLDGEPLLQSELTEALRELRRMEEEARASRGLGLTSLL
eukprot:TRINITY_DN57986_c0_g1_i1.p1 TRINITY_DN57986_c0_g1~~TRINITY_DN57986_c0_g1_i1.p1  ORF type:complete len:222 (-),score=46.14 TRINITY_DN57986_c0_g1_i1:285-950(-)